MTDNYDLRALFAIRFNFPLFLFCIILLAAGPNALAQPTTLYVDRDASPSDCASATDPSELDGTSWECAYPALQDAFDVVALDMGTDYEVWVAAGTYYPDEDLVDTDGDGSTEHTSGSRDEHFLLARDDVALYGGFDGTETQRSERDPSTNVVILSGDIGQDDLAFAPETDSDGNASTPAQIDHVVGGNAYQVLILDGRSSANLTTSTVIDGLTITGGFADGPFPQVFGGGLYCIASDPGDVCSPMLNNLNFEGNFADQGGAIDIYSGQGTTSPIITGSTFRGNYAATEGGAIRTVAASGGTASMQVSGSHFTLNGSDLGGAISSLSTGTNGGPSTADFQVTNTTFSDNGAPVAGGGLLINAAGGGSTQPTITGCSFSGNSANRGGAIHVRSQSTDSGGLASVANPSVVDATLSANSASDRGGAVFIEARSGAEAAPTISTATFSGNTANYGGAIENFATGTDGSGSPSRAAPSIENSAFLGNATRASGFDGGALVNRAFDDGEAALSVVSSLFSGNSASTNGGALKNRNDGTGSSNTATSTLINVTFAGNMAGGVGGAVFNDGASSGLAEVSLSGTILWANAAASAADLIYNDGASAQVTIGYSLFESTSELIDANGASTTLQAGNVTQNPAFAGSNGGAGPDGSFGTEDDDLRIKGPGSSDGPSPAIDAGDNTALPSDANQDLAGNDRRQDVASVSDTGNGTAPVVDIGAYESTGSPLPVELVSFTGRADDTSIHLSWSTASETNNAGFYVQRKTASGQWNDLAFVDGAGTTAQPRTYAFTDDALPFDAASITYRLHQIDRDGSATPSAPVVIERGAPAALALLPFYPNPASETVTVRYAAPQAGPVHIDLYDIVGRRVGTLHRGRAEHGRHAQTVDLPDLASGVYFVRLRTERATITRKLIVVR